MIYAAEKLTPLVEAKDGTNICIDETDMTISNIPQGTKDLSQYLDYKGCSLSYVETYNGFGTGTKVKAVSSDGVEVAEFTIVIEGDVTGDGYVDAFDLAVAGEYINTFTEPDEIAFIRAMWIWFLTVISMSLIWQLLLT